MFFNLLPRTRTVACAPAASETATTAERELPVVEPAVELRETAESMVILARMPGVSKDGVELAVADRVLTIRGRNSAPIGEAWYREWEPAHYERLFHLGEQLDAEKITARISDGVLRVEIGKRSAAQTRKIAVE